MFRSICGGLALAACSFSVLSGAPRAQEDLSTLPMRFALHQEGPADACGASCRLLISASGMITADTPHDFDAFVRGHNVRGATVVLDSKGGSVLGAIALGRTIRGLGLATTVGRVRDQSGHGVRRAWVWPRAECQSMCPFVLLGGVKRTIPSEARVLVHQIWLGDRRDDAAAASYSAEDLVLVQRDIGRLVQYTLEMGGGAELLDLALRIPPWEPMRLLSRDELRRTHLDTGVERVSPSAPTPVSSGVNAPAASGVNAPASPVSLSDGGRSEINPLGWVMTERSGAATLVRRHPLTVEGDKIGAFEVALACGPRQGTYTVTYAETRLSPDDRDATAVKQVDMWIEGKTEPLDVVSSRLNATPRQLETLASGAVAADLVQSFAEAGSDSLTLRTANGVAPGTLIRVGNTGFAQAYPQLAAACAAHPHLETRAELTAPTH
ncbi:MAG TPA: hypothetical protein VKX28_18645 [Xanthobacteraceae bacterium]|nr:hypothetical protein [Xanthobacteraceae bacterium]